MDDRKWLLQMNNALQKQVVLKTNEYTEKFGLSLTEDDTKLLLQERRTSLAEQERVEFGEGILAKLIFAFCDSPYIYQDNYVDSIGRLQEIFYYYKNETLDEMTDDELIAEMKEMFEGICQGSLDYLEETCMEKLARGIRSGREWGAEYDENE